MEISLVVVLTPSDIQSTVSLVGGVHDDNRDKSCSSFLTRIMDDKCFHNIVFTCFTYKVRKIYLVLIFELSDFTFTFSRKLLIQLECFHNKNN